MEGTDCIFCEMLAGRSRMHKIYEDRDHVAFVDIFPIDRGHSLVIPKLHYERVTDMSPDDVAGLFRIVPGIAKSILDATGAVAFSLAQNNGREARQVVPHVHVHIIPRYEGGGTTWTQRHMLTHGQMEETAKLIRGEC